MQNAAALDTQGAPTHALRRLLADLLTRSVVQAVLVPARQRHGGVVMHTLVGDPQGMDRAEPLAPVLWSNGATQAAALTRKAAGAAVAVVLRSCELRAFVELCKLNQARRDDLLLIGVDCFGRLENKTFLERAGADADIGTTFTVQCARGAEPADLATACRACELPVAPLADVRVCLIGSDPAERIWLEAPEPKGQAVLAALGFELSTGLPSGREAAVQALVARRTAFRDELFEAFRARTADVGGLAEAVAACVGCLNCRVACPVCYCRSCVHGTDLFRHEGARLVQKARQRSMLSMPTDTLFYHLTRMVHMSTSCVGCGQCSSACPNDVPVMELLRSTAAATQARFSYVPGRSFDEDLPLATFREDELQDATGQVK